MAELIEMEEENVYSAKLYTPDGTFVHARITIEDGGTLKIIFSTRRPGLDETKEAQDQAAVYECAMVEIMHQQDTFGRTALNAFAYNEYNFGMTTLSNLTPTVSRLVQNTHSLVVPAEPQGDEE